MIHFELMIITDDNKLLVVVLDSTGDFCPESFHDNQTDDISFQIQTEIPLLSTSLLADSNLVRHCLKTTKVFTDSFHTR